MLFTSRYAPIVRTTHVAWKPFLEVYRAEDTTLGREVAIKVLPEAFTADPERFACQSVVHLSQLESPGTHPELKS